jgi:hypothetical protein
MSDLRVLAGVSRTGGNSARRARAIASGLLCAGSMGTEREIAGPSAPSRAMAPNATGRRQ